MESTRVFWRRWLCNWTQILALGAVISLVVPNLSSCQSKRQRIPQDQVAATKAPAKKVRNKKRRLSSYEKYQRRLERRRQLRKRSPYEAQKLEARLIERGNRVRYAPALDSW